MSGVLVGRPFVYRDPIHGDIAYPRGKFQELVAAIVDSEAFQRLRGIRQNGVTNLVFHGAEHSRFTHSMGVAFIAGRMFDAASRNMGETPNAEERETTILAALLHDVGHGPFSHLLEEILTKSVFHHEDMTERIINESPVNVLLDGYSSGLANRLVPFINSKKRTSVRWYHSIVSSQLDADRLDYLARDCRMAGIFSHHFDYERLISFLGHFEDELVVDSRARDIVENYLLALDQMYEAVYYHKTVRAASCLLTATIRRAIDLAKLTDTNKSALFPGRGGHPDPLWLLVKDGKKIELPQYERLDEAHVWGLIALWRDHGDLFLNRLCTSMKTRRFPKAMPLPEDPKEAMDLYETAKNITNDVVGANAADYFVTLDSPSRSSYKTYTSGEGPRSSIKILVESPDGPKKVPVEAQDRSIANVVQKKMRISRLMVPKEVRDKMKK